MQPGGSPLDQELPSRPHNHEEFLVDGQRRYGMWWFLASLGVLFAATIVGYLAIRLSKPEWAQEELPPLPWTLGISTALLVLQSLSLEAARRRAASAYGVMGLIRLGLVLSVAFLGAQGWSWWLVQNHELSSQASHLYSFAFFMLTVLHALHVVGGVISLAWVQHKARQGAYSGGRTLGLDQAVLYWHFLLVTWIVLYAVLALVN